MEFWGIEVKADTPFIVKPEDGTLIHISQAALGEVKSNNNKGVESVALHLKIDGENFVLGTLAAVTRPQIPFDLVFEKEFELSHNWKNGSIYLMGYVADNPDEVEGDDFSSDEFDSEDEMIPEAIENGKIEPKVDKQKASKPVVAPAKPESKPKTPVVPNNDNSIDSDDSEDDSDFDDAPELGSDSDMSEDDESDDDDESDKDDDEDEETPVKPVSAKKRPCESALKTPVQAKKAKSETPQKTEGKKSGGHTATPHPAKKAVEKTPASKNNKGKEQIPKSAGSIKCNSCAKTFNSDGALQSHSKAKHSAAK